MAKNTAEWISKHSQLVDSIPHSSNTNHVLELLELWHSPIPSKNWWYSGHELLYRVYNVRMSPQVEHELGKMQLVSAYYQQFLGDYGHLSTSRSLEHMNLFGQFVQFILKAQGLHGRTRWKDALEIYTQVYVNQSPQKQDNFLKRFRQANNKHSHYFKTET